jgi:hypothetical protein
MYWQFQNKEVLVNKHKFIWPNIQLPKIKNN